MYSLGQTLRENGKDNLILYLGWHGNSINFVSENGKIGKLDDSDFSSKYTHIVDEFGMATAGIHEQVGSFFGYWPEGESLKPDMNLRGYLFVDSEECEILRENRIGKVMLDITDFIESRYNSLNLSNGDSAYRSDFFLNYLEDNYPRFEFIGKDYYLINNSLLKMSQGHMLEKVSKEACKIVFDFMSMHLEKMK